MKTAPSYPAAALCLATLVYAACGDCPSVLELVVPACGATISLPVTAANLSLAIVKRS